MNIKEFEERWDKEVKSVAEDVIHTCKTDGAVSYFVSQMIFYIEHDLADGRIPIIRLYPCVGTLNDENYYNKIHKNTSEEEVEKLRKLGKLLLELRGE